MVYRAMKALDCLNWAVVFERVMFTSGHCASLVIMMLFYSLNKIPVRMLQEFWLKCQTENVLVYFRE